MGTLRLTRLDTGDFYRWVRRLGFRNESEFWTSLSGLPRGSVVDHMNHYLTALGYQGHINDKFRQFMMDQITAQGASLARLGTLYDLANQLYTLSFDDGGGVPVTGIEDDDGYIIHDDDGNVVHDDDGN